MSDVAERLFELREAGLHRELREVSGPQGPRVLLDGREVLLLCSNNYLGLANHPALRKAAAAAATRWGTGAGASRLISGSMTLHRRLEERLAGFEDTEAALLFGSGYLANLGTVSALSRRGEVVFSDELNHASIIDGCRLSRAETFVYRHADVEHLAWGLEQAKGRGSLIVTDSVFSMDGDIAPLPELAELAHRFDCRLMVDEAHATGALGPGGRGAVAAADLVGEVDVVVGTLGKALGGYGAYVCTNTDIRELLVNASRPFIFSTALPPPVLGAAYAALDQLESRPERVARLQANAATLRRALAAQGFSVQEAGTQIVPIVVGDAASATAFCEAALGRDVFAQAIRPPTVPEGSSRLRLTVTATHREQELVDAAKTLAEAAHEVKELRASVGTVADPEPERLPESGPSRRRPSGEAPAKGVSARLRRAAGTAFAGWGSESLDWQEAGGAFKAALAGAGSGVSREEPIESSPPANPDSAQEIEAEPDWESETAEFELGLRRAA